MKKVTNINPVHMCTGCHKAGDWTAAGGWVCSVYKDPKVLMYFRHGTPCPFNRPVEVVKKKFVNPIKASKRR
jgi:hypothetical protein